MKILFLVGRSLSALAAVAVLAGPVEANSGEAASVSATPAAATAATAARLVTKPAAAPESLAVNTGVKGDSKSLIEVKAGTAPPLGAAAIKVAAAGDANSAAKPAAPATTLRIAIDLTKQQMTVKENGKVLHAWPISSGREGYRTITGKFKPQWMTRMHYSRKYDNAPMPNSIFFSGGFAIHATYSTGLLGSPASHGCVRLSPGNAKKLYALVEQHGRQATSISLFGQARDRAPMVARHKSITRYTTTSAGPSYSRYAGSSWSNDKVRRGPVRQAQPQIIYRNGQAYVYVGPQKARQYWKQQRYTGGYYNY